MAFSDSFKGRKNAFTGIRYCTKWVLIALVVAVSMVSCKPSVPSEYIQKGKMENILFDYHLAKVMFEQEGKNDSLTLLAYQESIFEKYDVTRAEFDCQWYITQDTCSCCTRYMNIWATDSQKSWWLKVEWRADWANMVMK